MLVHCAALAVLVTRDPKQGLSTGMVNRGHHRHALKSHNSCVTKCDAKLYILSPATLMKTYFNYIFNVNTLVAVYH